MAHATRPAPLVPIAAPADAPADAPRRRLTALEWLICTVAALGFAFDLYEMLVMPLVLRPALVALGGLTPGSREFNRWVALMFYAPALAGGAFGLLGAYGTDLFGRRRVLVWSVLLYAGAALGAGLATSLPQLLAWRCLTVIGVAVEYVAAVAWLAELFPDAGRRERVLAYTQSAAGLGGLMASGAYYLAVTFAERLPSVGAAGAAAGAGAHEAWRYALLFGLAPAIPLALVRPLLPESPAWRAGHTRTVRRPRVAELFGPSLRRTTLVTTLLFACAYGMVSGVLQQTPRVVPGLLDVTTLAPRAVEQAVGRVQFVGELGVIAGRLLFAFLVVRVARQRRLAAAFFLPALLVVPLLYASAPSLRVGAFTAGVFVIALLVNGPVSLLWNYVPRAFPTRLRGTGEGFAHNVGSRWLGALAVVLTTQLANVTPGATAPERLTHAVATTAALLLALALAASRALPEPASDRLPD
jgi:MFS family permease